MIYTGLFFEVLQSRLMESQKKDPPLENLTREKPKLTGTHLILYHGTDDNGGNDIALKGISIHSESRYHDFGRRDESHAFYLTPCRKLAEKFAMERALNNNRDRCAIVTIEVPVGPDVKHYQFEDVEEWRNVSFDDFFLAGVRCTEIAFFLQFVNYNRSRDVTKENKEKAQEIFRKGDDIISGWISMHVAGELGPVMLPEKLALMPLRCPD